MAKVLHSSDGRKILLFQINSSIIRTNVYPLIVSSAGRTLKRSTKKIIFPPNLWSPTAAYSASFFLKKLRNDSRLICKMSERQKKNWLLTKPSPRLLASLVSSKKKHMSYKDEIFSGTGLSCISGKKTYPTVLDMSEIMLGGRFPNKDVLSGRRLSVWKYWQAHRTSRPIEDIDDSLELFFRSLVSERDFSLLKGTDFSLRLPFLSSFGLSKLSDDLPLLSSDFFITFNWL